MIVIKIFSRAVVFVLTAVIRLYQMTISRFTPRVCRFTPTCSAYALTALRRHGVVKGLLLALWRIARCNPFSEGGLDTVP